MCFNIYSISSGDSDEISDLHDVQKNGMKYYNYSSTLVLLLMFSFFSEFGAAQQKSSTGYESLVSLFKEWRSFEQPPMRKGAPDYTVETFNKRWSSFKMLQSKLNSIDTTSWTVEHKVDWMIVWAEMNGYDFNHRVLKPWSRDPAFYKTIWMERSDVPAHEGPTHHAIIDIWKYNFPLSDAEKNKLIDKLKVIDPLNEQAKLNLTGNAKELWDAGIRDIRSQGEELKELLEMPGVKNDMMLSNVINQSITSTEKLVKWLEVEAVKKTGPSGIGKEHYNWYAKNVHLVPLTWDDQVLLLKRELARAWSSLKLEEHRNRKLPQLSDASTASAYDSLKERSAKNILSFLDKQELLTMKKYYEPALRDHTGRFVPKEKRNFFLITMHYDPRPLFSHFYHWFELAQMDLEPHASEIRRAPLLYNIFDSRNEGMATAVEEIFMQAGLYDDDPRVKEIVYILIAQRAARGLGSLYAHANELTMEEAGKIHSEYTPRGWMKTEKELLKFEQHLYMRQPGYGTSYITGKFLIDEAMAEYAKKLESSGQNFSIRNFLDKMNQIGSVPPAIGIWELTGDDGGMLKSIINK
jgi:hypothetical protein